MPKHSLSESVRASVCFLCCLQKCALYKIGTMQGTSLLRDKANYTTSNTHIRNKLV